jgi:Tol biopolymer transport system component
LSGASTVRNGPLTLFSAAGAAGLASIVTVAGSPSTTIQLCPHGKWCGENVSFAWAPGGRRVAYSLDEIGGNSTFIGLHVLNVRSGRDRRIPEGAPKTATITNGTTWRVYANKMQHRVGCFPAAELAWSPDGSSLAYICGPDQPSPIARGVYQLEVLKLRGSGHTTVPTGSAFWPSWSANGTRIAYSSNLHPTPDSRIYTVALDGSHRRLLASGAAPAWSPDGRTIAYQTTCGIRLVTPSGRDVTPTATAKACGAIGVSGPPVWSPDGTQLAVETTAGVYVMDKNGGALHLASNQATTTWRGGLPGRPSWQPIH